MFRNYISQVLWGNLFLVEHFTGRINKLDFVKILKSCSGRRDTRENVNLEYASSKIEIIGNEIPNDLTVIYFK